MSLEQVASRLDTAPEELQRDSLRHYLEHKLRVVESELFTLAQRYGVSTVFELDAAVQDGRFHEADTFENYFRFDFLASERETLRELLEQL
jgi:hypothetical protein